MSTVLGHNIVIDFAYFITIFIFTLNDYWYDGRANVNGSFRSGSFRPRSFRTCVLSFNFGDSLRPIISPSEPLAHQVSLQYRHDLASVHRPLVGVR